MYESNTGYGGGVASGAQAGSYLSQIGHYTNLPTGITNAGSGSNNAYVRTVQPNELVSNQLQGLLASNSPYMQNARAAGLNTANSRGLLNSSMAAGNSQMAAINAGLPIAQADAGAYGAAAAQNEEQLNTVLQNAMTNATSHANAGLASAAASRNAEMSYKLGLANLQYQGAQAGLGRQFQDYMARQAFGQQQQRDAFNLGGSLLLNNDNFTHQMYLGQADNPFSMSNPQALQGYIDWGNQNNNSYYDNLFNYGMNGGVAAQPWLENSSWYTSPNFNGNY